MSVDATHQDNQLLHPVSRTSASKPALPATSSPYSQQPNLVHYTEFLVGGLLEGGFDIDALCDLRLFVSCM